MATIYNVRQAVVALIPADSPDQAIKILRRRIGDHGFEPFIDVDTSHAFESEDQGTTPDRPLPPLHCPECGRYGNTEDAIELGRPCQYAEDEDDPCDGTIQSTRPVIQTDIDGRVMVTLPPLSMTTDQAIALVALLREVEADEPADDIEAVLGVGG